LAALDQATLVTPTASKAVPPRLMGEDDVLQLDPVVGLEMLTVGAVVSAVAA
jgi:hypothetical protein